MTFTPTAIALIGVLISGYVLAVVIGTMAYFANEKNY
ncbi:MAG: endonuclease [Waterburya sp.]